MIKKETLIDVLRRMADTFEMIDTTLDKLATAQFDLNARIIKLIETIELDPSSQVEQAHAMLKLQSDARRFADKNEERERKARELKEQAAKDLQVAKEVQERHWQRRLDTIEDYFSDLYAVTESTQERRSVSHMKGKILDIAWKQLRRDQKLVIPNKDETLLDLIPTDGKHKQNVRIILARLTQQKGPQT